jgi:hypothetical protein
MDEIAKKLGYSDLDDYVAKEVKSATLFGLTVDGGLRPDFYKKLQKAEAEAKKLITPTPTTAKDWGITSISGCQVRRRGWHPWGMAVDIDYIKNPYVMHESGEPAMDKLVTPIYHRIARLVLSREFRRAERQSPKRQKVRPRPREQAVSTTALKKKATR